MRKDNNYEEMVRQRQKFFGENFFDAYPWLLNFFSMPTLRTSKYFRRLLTFDPAPPPAMNNDRSLTRGDFFIIAESEYDTPLPIMNNSDESLFWAPFIMIYHCLQWSIM